MYPYPDEINNPDPNDEEQLMHVSSGQDCTGLIPAAPVTEDEYESYEETYDFLPNAASPEPRNRT